MTKEEALRRVEGYLTDDFPPEEFDEVEDIMKALREEHGIEIPIKKKGRWEFVGYGCYACSECGEVYTVRQFEAINNYRDNRFPKACPNCATEMEINYEIRSNFKY